MRLLHEDGSVSSLAWVLMPDHLHWVFQLGDRRSLAAVMKLLKGRSARLINESMKKSGPVWQKAYYDHAIREEEDIRQIVRYMLRNPLRAGLLSLA
jgi:REP element-mobilizing transposase RayT